MLSLQWLGGAAVPPVQSLAQEVPHAMGTAKKKKKKKNGSHCLSLTLHVEHWFIQVGLQPSHCPQDQVHIP